MKGKIIRCEWAKSELEQKYHDKVWGIPVHDDKELFKMLLLEGMQAGLSWSLILKRMDTLCEAFDDFDPEKLIKYDQKKVETLLLNEGIIRNRLKVNSAITNAHAYFKLCEEFKTLDNYLWSFINNKPIVNSWKRGNQIPANTPVSDMISKDMKKRGFKFVGTTIIYAFMQAVGMVNDHLVSCSFYKTRKK